MPTGTQNKQVNLVRRVIPSDEIWIKIGGDKGGGKSMKASFQLCNVLRPNAVQNTYSPSLKLEILQPTFKSHSW